MLGALRGRTAGRLLSTHATVSSSPGISFAEMLGANPMRKPELPVPSIPETTARYLSSIESLVAEEVLEKHRRMCALLEEHGQPMQDAVERAWRRTEGYPHNFIEEVWDSMYLRGRWALPVHSNPFHELCSTGRSSVAESAALVTHSLLKWMDDTRRGGMEWAGENDMRCPRQIALQIGSARVPGASRDTLRHTPFSKHVVFLCNGSAYRVDAFREDGTQLSLASMLASIQRIVSIEEARAGATSDDQRVAGDVGLLTRLRRDEWARLRGDIAGYHPQNQRNLECIDEALIVVALDLEAPGCESERSHRILKGDRCRNRWHDKHQVIVQGDGSVGINFEHSFSDGLAWQYMLSPTMQGALELEPTLRAESGEDAGAAGDVQHLSWALPAHVQEACALAHDAADSGSGDCETKVLRIEGTGKDTFKSWGMSPDAAFQIALQAAYQRVHRGEMPPTYESCAMSNFVRGRTETIRSATPEAAAFVRSFANADWRGSATAREQVVADARRAAARHVAITREASRGGGVDRHLLALELAATATGEGIADARALFQDATFNWARTWKLSTSNLSPPWPCIRLFGFGPVSAEGYGVGYLIHRDRLDINVTNFGGGSTDGSQLARDFAQVFSDMRRLFEQ